MKIRYERNLMVLMFLFFLSCHTFQKDIQISGMDETFRADLAMVEETIVRLEFAPRESALNDARRRITSLSRTPDNDFQAMLTAWSGRLFILEGDIGEAQREMRRSQTLSPGNWVSVILASRLERSAEQRLVILEMADHLSEGMGELQIEKGRVLLEMGRFPEAVAAFDLAFLVLENKPFYRENFQVSRDRAWELRNIDQGTGTRVLELVQQDNMSWLDLIEITRTETDYLRFLTAGRDWSAEEIFTRLLERSFIPLTQDITVNEWSLSRPRPGETVLRSGTAWFLWHLHAENRANRTLLSRYSSRYANTPNARSPVNDLPLLSPFFDSILGCVESEFMSLPDGRNFSPAERVRPSAFLTMLRKLD